MSDSHLTTVLRLPRFSKIRPEHIEPAIKELLDTNRAAIERLLQNDAHTWDSLIEPMADLEEALEDAWSPVSHLNSVMNSPELRQAYNACLPLLTEYSSELGQNERLYQAYLSIAEGQEYGRLDTEQRKVIDNAIRDFKLAGVALNDSDKKVCREIRQRLSELNSKFSENVMDATQAWSELVTDPGVLTGVPSSILEGLKQQAEEKGQQGFLINLDLPTYIPVMTYCDNSELRQRLYTAYVTRASDQGPYAERWDNTGLIDEMLVERAKLADVLGFENYVEYSLATKMAESGAQVVGFLQELADKALPFARQEFAELQQFAAENYQLDRLQPWDLFYFSEKLRQQRYDFSQEMVRPYFPLETVIEGMFDTVSRLYGIHIRKSVEDVDLWHPEVRFYDIKNQGETIGHFYLDLHARENKRGGAWMDECKVRRVKSSGELQLPVAYLVCNFSRPVGNHPALLTHNEVTTLFHEFGHGLHHLLTQVRRGSVSGIRGVAWDAVELPSQFMENWCWQPQAIELISSHYRSGASLPPALLEKMLAAKNFQSGMQILRQLEFALFDLQIHLQTTCHAAADVQQVLNDVRAFVSVVPVAEFNKFQHGFLHIFAGGYAAGYYSYKWAELLSADAFSRFEEEGIFNPRTGASFLQNILHKGGSVDAAELFRCFMGRAPKADALLRHSGLVTG